MFRENRHNAVTFGLKYNIFYELKKFVKQKTAPHKYPRAIVFVDALPVYRPNERTDGLTPLVIGQPNHDDLSDYRPGLRALSELEVRSPLLEAKLNKFKKPIIPRQILQKNQDGNSTISISTLNTV